MRFRCRHRWTVVERRYTPPIERGLKFGDASGGAVDDVLRSLNRAAHGFTTIEQRCSECGLTDLTEALGDQRSPLNTTVPGDTAQQ